MNDDCANMSIDSASLFAFAPAEDKTLEELLD